MPCSLCRLSGVPVLCPSGLSFSTSRLCPSSLAQLAMSPAKKAKLDFLGQVSKKFVGNGDPETSDAKDVVTYLSEKYTPAEWKNMLQE